MSVDYLWFFIHLSSEEETKIMPLYQDALQKAVFPKWQDKFLITIIKI